MVQHQFSLSSIEGASHIQDALVETLERFGEKRGRSFFNQAARRSFSGLVKDARRGTPKRTGASRRSIGVRAVRPTKREAAIYGLEGWHVRFGFFLRKGMRWQAVVGIEYGNRKIREHSPLRNALARWQSRLTNDIRGEVDRLVARNREKLARKLAQNG